jgi:hypothetical protein
LDIAVCANCCGDMPQFPQRMESFRCIARC